MAREAITAVVTSGVLGAFSLAPKRYVFWWKWTPTALVVAITLYLAMNGAGGVLGWLVARVTHWRPANEWFLDGVIFGLAGQGLLRIEVSGFGVEQADEARSAIRLGARRVIEGIETVSANAVERFIARLSDDELAALAYKIYFTHIQTDDAIPNAVKAELLRQVDDALNEIDQGAAALGRGRLLGFCIDRIRTQRLVVV